LRLQNKYINQIQYVFYLFIYIILYSRNGRALRLSCDHKGSNLDEVQRITDAGGFVLNARVNGKNKKFQLHNINKFKKCKQFINNIYNK